MLNLPLLLLLLAPVAVLFCDILFNVSPTFRLLFPACVFWSLSGDVTKSDFSPGLAPSGDPVGESIRFAGESPVVTARWDLWRAVFVFPAPSLFPAPSVDLSVESDAEDDGDEDAGEEDAGEEAGEDAGEERRDDNELVL